MWQKMCTDVVAVRAGLTTTGVCVCVCVCVVTSESEPSGRVDGRSSGHAGDGDLQHETARPQLCECWLLEPMCVLVRVG